MLMKKFFYKYIWFLAIFILLITTDNIFPINKKTLFNKIKQKNNAYLPKSFTAMVTGRAVRKSVAKIPKKSYKGNPYVKFLFHKKYGERIIVENVEEIYKDRFAVYLNMYKDFKIFLKPKKTYSSFTNRYEWKIIGQNSANYIIRMRKKTTSKGNYFKIFINKRTLQITLVINYKNNSPAARYYIVYKQIGSYRVVSRLHFRGNINGKFHRITFYFRRVKINANLKENDFLN